MKEQNLPKNYKGYRTGDLLDIWNQIAVGDGIVPGTPREKIRAMNRFLREYEIAPVYKVAAQLKRKNSAIRAEA
ncbi:hypothetical protein [Candidatus Electrothrix sp.]|uniref:hypothetical protein n=1 Tax=Candidatus Electrothrix sp. TaxID=2170559 RepID=UPI004057C9CF